MAEFAGSYKFEKDDGHFDDFLKAINVSFMTRKLASTQSPTVDITVNDDGSIAMKTSSTFKTVEIVFKLGEEFDEKRMDDVVTKSIITKDGNKLIHHQKAEPPVEIVREFTGDKMVVTCKCKNVVNVREYKKL